MTPAYYLGTKTAAIKLAANPFMGAAMGAMSKPTAAFGAAAPQNRAPMANAAGGALMPQNRPRIMNAAMGAMSKPVAAFGAATSMGRSALGMGGAKPVGGGMSAGQLMGTGQPSGLAPETNPTFGQ